MVDLAHGHRNRLTEEHMQKEEEGSVRQVRRSTDWVGFHLSRKLEPGGHEHVNQDSTLSQPTEVSPGGSNGQYISRKCKMIRMNRRKSMWNGRPL